MTQDLNSFSARLQSQLLQKRRPLSPTQLAREFNLRWRGTPVSTNAARKWLYGPTMPKMEKIQVLAKMLGTSAEWLRWGHNNDLAITESVSHKQPIAVTLMDTQLADSVLHDWSRLTDANKKLIAAILELLIENQQN